MAVDGRRLADSGGIISAVSLRRVGIPPSELLDLISRPAWWGDALCHEYPDVNFFPSGRGADAKAVCGRCLVRDECLAAALEHDESDGVFGGTTPQERRLLRRGSAA